MPIWFTMILMRALWMLSRRPSMLYTRRIASTYESRCSGASHLRIVWPMYGVRPETAADEHLEADLAALVLVHPQADVVDRDRGAVVRRARDRDLELARQVRELGMQERVLAQQLAIDARIGELVLRAARELVRRDVADAVARGLDRVHLDVAELVDDVRHLVRA